MHATTHVPFDASRHGLVAMGGGLASRPRSSGPALAAGIGRAGITPASRRRG